EEEMDEERGRERMRREREEVIITKRPKSEGAASFSSSASPWEGRGDEMRDERCGRGRVRREREARCLRGTRASPSLSYIGREKKQDQEMRGIGGRRRESYVEGKGRHFGREVKLEKERQRGVKREGS